MVAIATIVNETRSNLAEPGVGDALDSVRDRKGCPFASFQGPGIFLEDLFARPRLRGQSVGRALLARVARIAEKADGIGIMFDVLDWNHGAIEFYRRMGATFLDDWKTFASSKNSYITSRAWRRRV
jgi:GNAT superfamily N-acetyltransferase